VPRLSTDVLHKVPAHPQDAEALLQIEKGYIQETTLTRGQANSLIGRLERAGLIPRGEFRVRTFREGDKKKIGISHDESNQPLVRITYAEKAKVPTLDKAVEFIEAQPQFRHDMGMFAEHFVGRRVDSDTESAFYHALRDILDQAQQAIVHTHGGKFTSQHVKRRKVYQWSKQ